MNRFFVPSDKIASGHIVISGTDVNHITNVLRKGIGDELLCFDGSGREYVAKISTFSKREITLIISSSNEAKSEPSVKISLAQALPKMSKMDDIVKKSVELGVYEILPVISERCITKKEKTGRWKKISKEAAQQSGRAIVPEIKDVARFENAVKDAKADLKIIAWEGETSVTIKQVLKGKEFNSIFVLIGPEGGFSSSEVAFAREKGFTCVTLGKRILRTETAGSAVIAMIVYEKEY